jgi:hypothetical protein
MLEWTKSGFKLTTRQPSALPTTPSNRSNQRPSICVFTEVVPKMGSTAPGHPFGTIRNMNTYLSSFLNLYKIFVAFVINSTLGIGRLLSSNAATIIWIQMMMMETMQSQ